MKSDFWLCAERNEAAFVALRLGGLRLVQHILQRQSGKKVSFFVVVRHLKRNVCHENDEIAECSLKRLHFDIGSGF